MSTITDDDLYQGYFTKVYQHTQAVYSYTPQEKAQYAKTGICITYGELLYPSVKKIISHMGLSNQDTFLDLGSGAGKCALQVFMQTDVRKVIGIEASPSLNQQALVAIKNLQADFPMYWEENRDCVFMEKNFLHESWDEATTVYTCSTCFTQELLIAIAQKINNTPNIKQVLSLRPLPLLKMPLKEVFQVECSWDSALCYLYSFRR